MEQKPENPTVTVDLTYADTTPRPVEWTAEAAQGPWTLTEAIEQRLSNFLGRAVRF